MVRTQVVTTYEVLTTKQTKLTTVELLYVKWYINNCNYFAFLK